VKQLTGLDGSFLYMETPTSFGHVNGLGIYERPSPEFDPYAAVYRRYASMVGALEPMRRRIVEVPMHLDHPYWINDPNFDLDFHIRHMSLAPPGRPDQLADQVARIVGRPMDRTRPLWEVYVIEGLQDDTWALLTKYHHATIDGASGVMMLTMMNDLSPDADPPGESPPWTPEKVPSDLELLRLTVLNLLRNPAKAIRVQLRMVRDVANAAGITGLGTAAQQAGAALRSLSATDGPRVALPSATAPPTPWNRSITAHRRFAMRNARLGDLKRLKDSTGGTINDVVMAICAGALRQYLTEHDALPDRPLRAMVPVSIRTGDEEDTWTNRVSGLVVDLPTDVADPLQRVAKVREAMDAAKRQFELVPAEALVDIQQYSSPVVATAAIRLAARLRLADRVDPPVNVIISNVPGPRQPLYLDGARLANYIPVSTIAEGMGLNITVHSYLDTLEFGLISCRELVPDLWHMVDLHIDELGVLLDAAGLPRDPEGPAAAAAPAKKAAPARKRAPAKKTTAARKRAPAQKTTAARKRAPAKKTTAARKRAPAKKTTAARKRAPAKKTTAARKRAPAKKATTARKRAPAKKAAAKRSA
jgi:diacylglycerol O-acyltransferase / wax synthase